MYACYVIFVGMCVLLMLTGCTTQRPNTSKEKQKIDSKNLSRSNREFVAEFTVMCDADFHKLMVRMMLDGLTVRKWPLTHRL